MPDPACRCEWDGTGDHPCHGHRYTCGKPAKRYYYEPSKRYSLAGAQPKVSVVDTWACDDCWAEFRVALAKFHAGEMKP